MIQSGVKKILLYSGFDVHLDTVSDTEIENLSGTFIEIPCSNYPKLDFTTTRINRKLLYNYTVSFSEFDRTGLSELRNKFGWFPYIEFYNGDTVFVNSPFFPLQSEWPENEAGFFPVTMQPNRPTNKPLKVK
jgi:hypothetical protein